MRLLFASDSFKGSLSAVEICDILEKTAQRVFPGAVCVSVPVADGGEGTVDALLKAMGGRRMQTEVTGPCFEPTVAEWGLLEDGKTAIIEMAAASGLPLVPEEKRDPRETTSYGTGELIACALRNGARHLLIGIGGSATNDGGMGMLAALGAQFLDEARQPVRPVGGSLSMVQTVNFAGLMPELVGTEITVICDVNNPLLGANGATYIYGPQKGATESIRDELEAGMTSYSAVIEKTTGRSFADFPGAGAAGGMGAALGGVLNARLKSGIDAVLETVRFEEKLQDVDLVVTGEGRMDGQSVRFGKVPVGVARRCAAKQIPVLAIVGSIGEGAEGFLDLCEGTLQTTVNGPMPLDKAMAGAAELYESAAERLFRAVRIGMKIQG